MQKPFLNTTILTLVQINLSLSDVTGFVAAHNSDIHLSAEAGKSTHLMSKDKGLIKCTGTTLIGFKCEYSN